MFDDEIWMDKKSWVIGLIFWVVLFQMSFQSVAALSIFVVTNNLHLVADTKATGFTATPIMIQVYSSASATTPCASLASLAPGASFTLAVGPVCSAINRFVITPLASVVNSGVYPYGHDPISVKVTTTEPMAAFLVTDTGQGTAPSGKKVGNGVSNQCYTPGVPVGAGDTSYPPYVELDSSCGCCGRVLCYGAPAVLSVN